MQAINFEPQGLIEILKNQYKIIVYVITQFGKPLELVIEEDVQEFCGQPGIDKFRNLK